MIKFVNLNFNLTVTIVISTFSSLSFCLFMMAYTGKKDCTATVESAQQFQRHHQISQIHLFLCQPSLAPIAGSHSRVSMAYIVISAHIIYILLTGVAIKSITVRQPQRHLRISQIQLFLCLPTLVPIAGPCSSVWLAYRPTPHTLSALCCDWSFRGE